MLRSDAPVVPKGAYRPWRRGVPALKRWVIFISGEINTYVGRELIEVRRLTCRSPQRNTYRTFIDLRRQLPTFHIPCQHKNSASSSE